MAFRWLVAVLNNCISTNVYGHFESFRFFNQEIALLEGLGSDDEPASKISICGNTAGTGVLRASKGH